MKLKIIFSLLYTACIFTAAAAPKRYQHDPYKRACLSDVNQSPYPAKTNLENQGSSNHPGHANLYSSQSHYQSLINPLMIPPARPLIPSMPSQGPTRYFLPHPATICTIVMSYNTQAHRTNPSYYGNLLGDKQMAHEKLLEIMMYTATSPEVKAIRENMVAAIIARSIPVPPTPPNNPPFYHYHS